MGKNPTQEEMQKIIANIDPQGEGCVNFEQFMRVSLAGRRHTPGLLSAGLRPLSVMRDGPLTWSR